MGIVAVSYETGPNRWEQMPDITSEVWPEYNQHGDVLNRYWGRLYDEFPAFQFMLYDESTGEVVAEGHTAPCVWDGTLDGLGDGIDSMIIAAFEARARCDRPTALCALAAEIRPGFQGRGLAARMLEEMAAVARTHDLANLIAPVRPSWKDRYPLTPIERYVTWTRDDGEPLDPWLRVHTRFGGQLAKPVPRSLQITATVAKWEQWTGLRFPDDGVYTFPDGLAPVTIDHAADRGEYWEPNVWVVHRVRARRVARPHSHAAGRSSAAANLRH
jgi:GNAT superfamily N-acetyltransferase